MQPTLFTDAVLATCDPGEPVDTQTSRHPAIGNEDFQYGLLHDSALACIDGEIKWFGKFNELPDGYRSLPQQSLNGRLLTPRLIDCHTHIVHGGNRATEFEKRLRGVSYEDIARAGGGIVSTVAATREASVEELVSSAQPRIDALLAEGVGITEIKSGYGLNQATEINMLRAARLLQDRTGMQIKTSFLGAHAVPAEYSGESDRYIDEVCIPTLKLAQAEGLVDAVDGFCEGIAFNPQQIKRVFDCAKQLELPVKLHAEQLSLLGGAQLAAEYGALSCDHLEYLDEAGVRAMASAGTVAVLLPGAFYTLRETQLPPVDHLRLQAVPIAIATDCNPGSSPLTSLLLAMNMACTLFRLTPAEALLGVTLNAARALGMDKTHGTIAVGKRAEFSVWNVAHPAELCYRIGFNPLHCVI